MSSNDKIYERGDDEDKDIEGWDGKSINRVRLEHTDKLRKLKVRGLYLFPDLLEDCKVVEINKDIWNFKKFDNTYKFPRDIDVYPDNDIFQNLYIAALKENKRPDKYIVDVDYKELLLLKRGIVEAMESYDAEWRSPVIRRRKGKYRID